MCVIELEPCTVWQEHEVTARKAHMCDCCRGEIPAGARYVRHFSVFEGDASTEKLCKACEEVRQAFDLVHGTHGTPSSMPDLLSECVSEEWTWSPNEDDDERVLTEVGALWRQALDEMKARAARNQKGTKREP